MTRWLISNKPPDACHTVYVIENFKWFNCKTTQKYLVTCSNFLKVDVLSCLYKCTWHLYLCSIHVSVWLVPQRPHLPQCHPKTPDVTGMGEVPIVHRFGGIPAQNVQYLHFWNSGGHLNTMLYRKWCFTERKCQTVTICIISFHIIL